MAPSYDKEERGEPQASPSSIPSFLGFLKFVFSKNRRSRDDYYDRKPSHPALQTTTTTTADQPPARPHEHGGPISTNDKLATFRRITGITSGHELIGDHRPALNIGIYTRVVRNEKQASEAFKLSSRTINGCYALQLIVAAALTALGAGNGPHAAVTVFGAINTVIAGFLTYLKGSGLPNRHKFYASSWSKVREYMEQREREFERADCLLDVEEVIRKVEDMYEEVRLDVEANEPEAYTSTGQLKRNEGLNPGLPISDHTGEFVQRPRLIGDRPTALSTARFASYAKTNVSPQNQGYAQNPTFIDSKLPDLGAGKFLDPSHKPYNFAEGIVGGGRDRPFSPPLPQMGGYFSPAVAAESRFDGSHSSYPTPYIPHLSTVDRIDHQTQESIQASLEKIQSAKRMEARMEDVVQAKAAAIEDLSTNKVNEVRDTVAREIEEDRLQAARRMEDGVEMLKRAGEERVKAARSLSGRVEEALSERLKKVEEDAKELL